ncbi:MAG: DctP family TRAP transporter solute-binding subunit [Lawsonibacter sp.]|nr:DctP family TRAP transporter solute-binding subunit [Lawsonibacter sp.]MCI9026943.1 DctP family TRAP transporter solute-binding subunit [Lawsonibacter sp.]MCI9293632.1 DctP family TRAP transporter solute-binding subunit [Lawsonibacter sp.]
MKKKVMSALLAGAMLFALAACGNNSSNGGNGGNAGGGSNGGGNSGAVIELRMGNVTSSSAKDAVTEVFIPKVEEYSNGTIKITHFPDNQLGNDEQSFAMAQTGECDIAVGSTSSVATTYNDLYLYDIPYMFLNKQEVYEVGFNGEAGKAILDGFSGYGLKGLAFWENGFRNVTTNNKDIAAVTDLNGLKIRTMANEIHLEAWKAMGANPTPMAFGELFTAMQQGTVDGQENPLGIITGNKFEEIEKFCTLTEHVYTPYYVVMNLEKWNSLTAEQQDALTRAMEETTQRQYELSQKYEDEAVGVMEAAGCKVRTLTDEEKLSFKEAADKANSLEAAKKIMYKPELADQMSEELAAYRSK